MRIESISHGTVIFNRWMPYISIWMVEDYKDIRETVTVRYPNRLWNPKGKS